MCPGAVREEAFEGMTCGVPIPFGNGAKAGKIQPQWKCKATTPAAKWHFRILRILSPVTDFAAFFGSSAG
jgi:hypothetical protein